MLILCKDKIMAQKTGMKLIKHQNYFLRIQYMKWLTLVKPEIAIINLD